MRDRATKRAAAEGRPLEVVLSESREAGHVSLEELTAAMDPRAYLGWSAALASELGDGAD